jgi:hypothetical protein
LALVIDFVSFKANFTPKLLNMKTTDRLKLALTILVALFCQNHLFSQDGIYITGVLPETAVVKSQEKFQKRYSTEKEIGSDNAVIRVNLIKEVWFDEKPYPDSANGLVFHYSIDDDNSTLQYLVSLGFVGNSGIIKHNPFPPNPDKEIDVFHYYLITARKGAPVEIIDAEQNKDDNSGTNKNLDSLHRKYDSLMNRLNWFGVFNRDVANIHRHPNMIYYHFDSLKVFYDEYRNFQECYLSENKLAKTIKNPELFLHISTGAYDGGNALKRRFHTPILRFGSADRAFEIDNNEYSGRRYKNKAFDVGVLCPPNCPSEIWPGR